MKFPRILIAAPGSGQGKTTVSMGLMAALCKRGHKVQPYKVGPDYIDPAFHTAITGRSSINLDSWMLDAEYIKDMFCRYSSDADISIIEGVMGLYDGMDGNPMEGSTASIAKLMDAPVVMVMQAAGMSASAAAMLHGFKDFGKLDIAGVIINRPSSLNHFNSVKSAIERYTDIKVLGFIPNEEGVSLKSRHLGLVQSCETEELNSITSRLADLIETNVDVDGLLEIARSSSDLDFSKQETARVGKKVKIAVARDKAFNFYYPENFSILENLGAELLFFSPLEDKELPEDCSGLYLGGGYPEVFAEQLHANSSMRKSILELAQKGMPIYAECGGYMFLNKYITTSEGKQYEFVGIFEGEAGMTAKLQNFGYTELTVLTDNYMLHVGERVRAHEFHRSVINRPQVQPIIKAEKLRHGVKEEWSCGMAKDNVVGFYPHVYFPANIKMAERFVQKCIKYKLNQ